MRIRPVYQITPKEVAEETKRAYDAGASLVHIHARDPKTKLATPDIKVWGEMVSEIRSRCPIVIEAGGGIGFWLNYDTFEYIMPTDEQKLVISLTVCSQRAMLNWWKKPFV